MSPEAIIQLLTGVSLWSVIGVMLVIGELVYLAFAYLMMRQINDMARAVKVPDDYLIRVLGVAHFVMAILVFLVSVVIL